MNRLVMLVLTVAIANSCSSVAMAHKSPCVPKKRIWKPKRPAQRKRVVSCPPPVVFCDCTDGRDGRDGKDGEDGKNIVVYSGLDVGVGYMGGVFVPEQSYAWSHGPSLRLSSALSHEHDFLLEAGWGMGRDEAIMAQARVTRWLDDGKAWYGLSGALYGQAIGLAAGRREGGYVALVPGVVASGVAGPFRFNGGVGLAIGWADYEQTDGDPVIGLVSSAGVSYDW